MYPLSYCGGFAVYFFTSDLHFGSEEIIEREARPFKNIREFEDVFVSNVNSVATQEDTLFVVGDWINYNNEYQSDPSVFEISRRILPSIVIVLGNGEKRLMEKHYHGDFKEMRSSLIQYGIEDVVDSMYIEFGGEHFFLTHHPKDHVDECINLFGHTHRGSGLWKPYGLNVGIDLNHFRPFSEAEILRLLKMKREWWDTDPDMLDF